VTRRSRVGETLAVLVVAAALLLNFPVLAVFNRATTLLGVPVLYLYVFGVWALAITAVVVLARRPWDDGE